MLQINEQSLDDRIDIEALNQLFYRIRKEVWTNMLVPLIVTLVMWKQVDPTLLIAWDVMMLIGIWVNYFIAVSYLEQNEPVTQPRKWGRRMSAVMLYFGILWVYAIFFFYVPDSVELQIFLFTIAIVFSLGSVMVGLYWFPMFYLLAIPVLTALIVRLVMEGTLAYTMLAALILWTLVGTGVMARMLNHTVRSEMRLRYQSVSFTEVLKKRTEEAQRATLEKSRFLAAASHDLRQPLHTLSLFLDVLKDSKSEEERKTIFSRIDLSLEALRKLFDALLDISRLDSGTVKVELSHFHIEGLLNKLAEEFEPAARQKNLVIRVHTCSSAVVSDPLLLERIMRNLIANAIRYTYSGGVLLSCRNHGDHIVLQVWDTGIGIPTESREVVFQEFQQLHNSHRDRAEGLGLGLALVKRMCLLLEHPLVMSSRPGRGTVFTISLPVGDAQEVAQSAPEKLIHNWDLGGRRVLVIDDERTILLVMHTLLSKWGCDVVTAESLEEAYESLSARRWVPELILSDLRLRDDKTGVEAIDSLREHYGEAIPGVLITGETVMEQLRLAETSQYEILQKPMRPAHLRSIIQHYLSGVERKEFVA